MAVEKYAQLMVVNRCIEPLSKLGVARWFGTTCYKELQEFSELYSTRSQTKLSCHFDKRINL